MMPEFKNIRIKMKGGKSRMQRVMVLASGKYKFVKNLGSKTRKSTRKSVKRTVTKRRTKTLGKRRRKRASRKFTIPIAPIAGIIAAPAVRAGINAAVAGDWDGVMHEASKFVGFADGKFDAFALASNVGPILVGLMVHKFVGGSPLNLNRMLASANVPIVRI